MHCFEAKNGYVFAPSDNHPDGITIERPAENEPRWVIHDRHLEVLWQYFDDGEELPVDGSVKKWERDVFFTFDDKGKIGGLTIRAILQDNSLEVRLDDEQVDALRELHEWLGTDAAKTVWTHRPTAVALAMLAVDNSPSQIDRIWADVTQRVLWIERAKAAIAHIDPDAQ